MWPTKLHSAEREAVTVSIFGRRGPEISPPNKILDSAILNTLARLGWSRGDKEVFYLDDLIRDFEITEVQKAGAIFDTTKLDFLNVQHMANLSLEEFIKYLEPFMQAVNIDLYTHYKYEKT